MQDLSYSLWENMVVLPDSLFDIIFSHLFLVFVYLVGVSILYLLLFSNRFFVSSLSTVSEKFMSYKFSKSLNSNIKFRAKVSKGHIDLPNSFYFSNVCFSLQSFHGLAFHFFDSIFNPAIFFKDNVFNHKHYSKSATLFLILKKSSSDMEGNEDLRKRWSR